VACEAPLPSRAKLTRSVLVTTASWRIPAPGDELNEIKFKRFYLASLGGGYYDKVYVESGTQMLRSSVLDKTASPMALFYTNSRWWFAYRSYAGYLHHFSSPSGDTDSWTYEGGLGYATTGGNAIGDWTQSNKVFRVY